MKAKLCARAQAGSEGGREDKEADDRQGIKNNAATIMIIAVEAHDTISGVARANSGASSAPADYQ